MFLFYGKGDFCSILIFRAESNVPVPLPVPVPEKKVNVRVVSGTGTHTGTGTKIGDRISNRPSRG